MWEWNETAYDGINNTAGDTRELRGGAWYGGGSSGLVASFRGLGFNPSDELYWAGFRVASVPEPSSFSLLVLGGVVVALGRRKR